MYWLPFDIVKKKKLALQKLSIVKWINLLFYSFWILCHILKGQTISLVKWYSIFFSSYSKVKVFWLMWNLCWWKVWCKAPTLFSTWSYQLCLLSPPESSLPSPWTPFSNPLVPRDSHFNFPIFMCCLFFLLYRDHPTSDLIVLRLAASDLSTTTRIRSLW